MAAFWAPNAEDSTTLLQELIAHAAKSGLTFSRTVLARTPAHTVVHCISNRILPLDDVYFPRLHRFAQWEDFTGNALPIAYHDSLFM